MTLWPIISHALLYGVILSAVLFTLALALARLNPEIMLKNYPPDIRAKHGPMSERSKRQRAVFAIVLIAIMVGIVIWSFQGVGANAERDISFMTAFIHFFVMFSVINLLDWLVLDWLIVVRIRPGFIILPGTEGLAGYGDYGFHFRGFLIGIVISSVISLLLSVIVAALF
jgi:uncharacterized MAPEG superfamily protein